MHARLPGAEIVEPGIRDLEAGLLSDDALAVLAAAPRLRRAGMAVPERADGADASQQLYLSLARQLGPAAHSRHHAVMRRVASFAVAYARAH